MYVCVQLWLVSSASAAEEIHFTRPDSIKEPTTLGQYFRHSLTSEQSVARTEIRLVLPERMTMTDINTDELKAEVEIESSYWCRSHALFQEQNFI